MHSLTKSVFIFALSSQAGAAFAHDGDAELIRNQQRQQQLDAQLTPAVDVRLDRQAAAQPAWQPGEAEHPCMAVDEIVLSGDQHTTFSFIVPKLMKQSGFQPGMCIGSNGMQQLQTLAQNIAISQGFITTRVYIAPQDLNAGRLTFTVQPGRTGNIRYEENNGRPEHSGRISAFANKFPNAQGDILNLRDLEQGLENLRRLPSVAADIRIEPGEQEGRSDIIVRWQQERPFRFDIGINDSGSKTTGKYQGYAALSIDNPLGLSDLLYLSYNHDLGRHKASYTDRDGIKTDSGTRGYSLHYSVPAANWLWAWNHSGYRYHEATEGINSHIDYNGKSYSSSISAGRVLFRNARHKTTATAKLWRRQTRKYYDNNEIEVQRRQTAGWAAELSHRTRLGRADIHGILAYKRGTGMQGSLKAPEEFNDDNDTIPGTSRMKILTASLSAGMPFGIGKQVFSYDTEIYAQWNKSPLVSQDRLSIGGRYTVRGFDGEQNLSGERGWFWQNNLNWHYLPEHQLYTGLDYGRVSGLSTQGLPTQKLAGAVIGLKGTQRLGGVWSYNVFAGKPLSKPAHLKTAATTYGFNLNYNF
ncbi:ShlB/FhaC/HecB family hemolysin secretion/activation protein [Uruburuella testudinis]|uniref:ShlB/FhaC/HecB family hemolysin secretion/activation protein n=1 Tax=Uruburuella testudinis TaxID=1282863 RepID=A0ABY4DTW1_9NEIS|nr:ShlB/FhaC/HecB family hemolysin secretion/activation protein [Uruburuella testudinis]UOO82473.1 ShlB/FhaC/HecB family hemolysin secretion/activation protein [Uruburuella testudinis]